MIPIRKIPKALIFVLFAVPSLFRTESIADSFISRMVALLLYGRNSDVRTNSNKANSICKKRTFFKDM